MAKTSYRPGEAFLADEVLDPTSRELEELVNQYSYDKAREMLGLEENPTSPSPESQTAQNIGAYTCGDCLVELSNGQSCAHMVVDDAGKSRIIG